MHLENIWENTYGEVINYCLRQGWEVDVKKGLFIYFFLHNFSPVFHFALLCHAFLREKKKGGGGVETAHIQS